MIRNLTFCALAGLSVAACQTSGPVADMQNLLKAPVRTAVVEAPPGAPEGTCWGQDVTPAVVETVTDHILVQPAQVEVDGTLRAPAIYKTETRQAIVRERRIIWFQTPCPAEMTPVFVETLQRALKARKLYRGPVTGVMDRATERAVQQFQEQDGLDSPILSMNAARKLGLIAYPVEGYSPPTIITEPAEIGAQEPPSDTAE